MHLDSLSISNSHSQGDTIKSISGKGYSKLYKAFFNVTGSYKVGHNMLSCIYFEVNHQHIGNIFAMTNTIVTNQIDTLTFSRQLHEYYEHQDKIWQERKNLTENAYANRTKVHFGISRDEYNKYGEDFQRNFYEGLIGYGTYELAIPIFDKKDLFVGLEINEKSDMTFGYNKVQENAELVKSSQIGYDAHESFRLCYFCSLYNMEIISQYDKFDGRTKHSLKCYWNKYIRIFDRY